MKKYQRRAAKALAKGTRGKPDRIVAVHEAGHAVAKVLSAGEMGYGYDLENAIKSIKIEPGDSRPSADGKMLMRTQGTTFGPMFSREIDEAAVDFKKRYLAEERVLNTFDERKFLSGVVDAGRLAGADLDRWFRARVFDAVSGPIAEAIVSNELFDKVWNGYEAEGDAFSVSRDAVLCGMSSAQAGAVIEEAAALSALLMNEPQVWNAVIAVSAKKPIGTLKGTRAVRIITSALGLDPIEVFNQATDRLRAIEQEIKSAKVATVVNALGKHHVIKGRSEIGNPQDGQVEAQAVCQCRFDIFAEALWRAFGDGALTRAA